MNVMNHLGARGVAVSGPCALGFYFCPNASSGGRRQASVHAPGVSELWIGWVEVGGGLGLEGGFSVSTRRKLRAITAPLPEGLNCLAAQEMLPSDKTGSDLIEANAGGDTG